jgi:anti-anti-sigma factor
MLLKFWGTRGSIPAPLRPDQIEEKVIYALESAIQRNIDLTNSQAIREFVAELSLKSSTVGGNTTCITIEVGDNLIIIDAGSGIRELGNQLMNSGTELAQKYGFYRGKGHACMFFTHTHWDHIQGLPFFIPFFVPGNTFDIYHIHDYVPKVIVRQMEQEFFPLQFSQVSASFRFHQLKEGEKVDVGGALINNIGLKHPGKAYAYRVEADDAIVVIATDAEYTDLGHAKLRKYWNFYANADVLVFDAMFSLQESFVKEDWGHSSALIGADIARESNVKRLLLFHHDPTSTDEEIIRVLEETQEYLKRKGMPLPDVIVAREGLELNLPEVGTASDFQLSDHVKNGVVFMTLIGKFGSHATEPFKEHLAQLLRTHKTNKVVLKMENLSELTTAGIRVLVDTHRKVKHLALVGVPQEAYQVLEWANVTDFFAIFDKDEAAITALTAIEDE